MEKSNPRDSAFDLVKGTLVLLMVVYHVMSIMSTATPEDYRYIRFISGSFIFISGYIIARFFTEGFQYNPWATSRRLFIRGLKILAIFTTLNLLIHLTRFGNVSKQQLAHSAYWENAWAIYFLGDGSISSFLILLPIAYLLIIAPLFLPLSLSKRSATIPAILLATLVAASLTFITSTSVILAFMLVGITGLSLGLIAASEKYRLVRFKLGPAMGILGLSTAVWFTGQYKDNLAMYSIGIALILKCLYDLASYMSKCSFLSQYIVLIGRYSLVSYISQILIIQTIFRLFSKQMWPLGPEIIVFCSVTLCALIGVCLFLDWARAKSGTTDRCYRLIFS